MLAVVTTTVESARLAGVRVRCQDASSLGLESIFADYASPLFEEYGLLFLESSYGTEKEDMYLEKYQDYVSYNAQSNKGLLLGGLDFFQVEQTSTFAEKVIYATDRNGIVLEQEICSVMEGELAERLIENLLERLEFVNQSKILTQFFQSINQISATITKVDKTVQKIFEQVEKIKEYKADFEKEIEKVEDLLERLEDARDDYNCADTEEQEESALNRIEKYERKIAKLKETIIKNQDEVLDMMKQTIEQGDMYQEVTKKVSEHLENVKEELLEKTPDIKEEIYQAIDKQVEELKKYSGGEGDFYQVEQTEQILVLCKETLGKTRKELQEADEDELLSVLIERIDCLEKIGFDKLKILFDNTKSEASGKDVIALIKNLLSDGMLKLVMGEIEISSAILEENAIVSREQQRKEQESFQEKLSFQDLSKELLEKGTNAVITDEYVLHFFNSEESIQEDSKKTKHLLNYEAEYVLNGKLSDKENLEKTIEQMVLLRTGLNLIYLFSDEESCTQAQALATAIVGFTGMMGLVRMTQLLVLAAWAYAEGITDVQDLVRGEKVPFLKTKENWKLSLSSLSTFGEENTGLILSKEKKGLSYNDYMRILLLKEKQSEKLYRIMDLIQSNLCFGGWDGFSMDNCIYAVQVKTTYFASPFFLRLIPTGEGGKHLNPYVIETLQTYSY